MTSRLIFTRVNSILLVCFACSLPAGCSGGEAPPDTVRVTGVVTYQGKPVPKGTVTFVPNAAATGSSSLIRPAMGGLNEDGSFELSTFASGDGALPGLYRVIVVSRKRNVMPEDAGKEIPSLIPKKYEDASKSGLTATVPADGDEPVELTFELQD